MKATFFKYQLKFKQPSGTSRGILTYKDTWFIKIRAYERQGIGECGMFRGLSCDDRPDYEIKLKWACDNISKGLAFLCENLQEYPAIIFGLEMAFKDFEANDPYVLFPSKFTRGQDSIPINGLIWMGDKSFMKTQIKEKIESGFKCIKIKIGAIDFDTELSIIKSIREEFGSEFIQIRLDANGAFSTQSALEKLKRLSEFDIHSIEQPIRQGQWEDMAHICLNAPIPIALDEELIGVYNVTHRQKLLQTIKPQYIILKPTLLGGFSSSQSWIDLADKHQIGWWVTSALESNIGLNAIAQWTHDLGVSMPQGLGTGQLFTNNICAPLEIKYGNLQYNPSKKWNQKF